MTGHVDVDAVAMTGEPLSVLSVVATQDVSNDKRLNLSAEEARALAAQLSSAAGRVEVMGVAK